MRLTREATARLLRNMFTRIHGSNMLTGIMTKDEAEAMTSALEYLADPAAPVVPVMGTVHAAVPPMPRFRAVIVLTRSDAAMERIVLRPEVSVKDAAAMMSGAVFMDGSATPGHPPFVAGVHAMDRGIAPVVAYERTMAELRTAATATTEPSSDDGGNDDDE